MINDNNTCLLCNHTFHVKDNFRKHIECCKLIHATKKQRQQEEDTLSDTLPSQREMYNIIQHLVLKCQNLQKDIQNLKQVAYTRKTKQVSDWISEKNGSASNRPTVDFHSWMKSVSVTTKHLENVFMEDLLYGMKQCLHDYLEKSNTILPICSFQEKANTFYVWSENEEDRRAYCWQLLSMSSFEKMISLLMHRFLQEFTKWQIENTEKIQSCEQEKEKNILCMIKINGGKMSDEKRISEMRKWLFKKLAKPGCP